MTPFADLVAASDDVAATRARSAKVARLAALLTALDADEVALATTYLSGETPQRQTGVGWAAVREAPPPCAEPTLAIRDVDAALAALAVVRGAGSTAERRRLLDDLLGRATAGEQSFLRRLLVGELRQGALEGVVLDAIAVAAGVEGRAVRRAHMLRGDLGAVAEAALGGGAAALDALGLVVGRPLQPMLAGSAPEVGEAIGDAPAAVEWKLDGIRVQVHRDGDAVRIFTRTLDEVTDRLPEVVEAVAALPVSAAVLDGEAIALREGGRPRPFQETSSRIGRRRDVAAARAEIPLSLFLFDVLHLDGVDLLDEPDATRHAALERLAPSSLLVPRTVCATADAAQAVLDAALGAGHEGVIVKALDAPYQAGRRGTAWVKVKPVLTLDLVVLAVEHGSGRRRGLLSNLHLGARDPAGGFVMVGKTFKGLTDELLAWQTRELRARAVREDDYVVHVRPELVVEIALDGVQTSSRYPGGVALRFARVRGYRHDRTPETADTIDTVRALLPG